MNKKTVPNSEILKTNYFYINEDEEITHNQATKQSDNKHFFQAPTCFLLKPESKQFPYPCKHKLLP